MQPVFFLICQLLVYLLSDLHDLLLGDTLSIYYNTRCTFHVSQVLHGFLDKLLQCWVRIEILVSFRIVKVWVEDATAVFFTLEGLKVGDVSW